MADKQYQNSAVSHLEGVGVGVGGVGGVRVTK